MSVYKTTSHIFSNPFEILPDTIQDIPIDFHESDNFSENLDLKSIRLWEQLYYIPGSLGIYRAVDPKIEFYLITYNLFLDLLSYETIFGIDAAEKLVQKANKLGIIFNLKFVESKNI